jgi:hypothetical protein
LAEKSAKAVARMAHRKFWEFDIIAHSHGGNVAMAATHLGVTLKDLILLSCPAHPNHYLPDFSRVKCVESFQIKFDWVIIADGGGTYFNHPRINDNILPKWFRRHDDTHDPDFWKKYGIAI